jgi:very-short-patch-repair endonuclease
VPKSALEEELLLHIRAARLPEPEREYKFHDVRRWRFDLAWSSYKVAVECQGGSWMGKSGQKSAHSYGRGFERDCEKNNAAILLGWKVLKFTGKMIHDGRAIQILEQILKNG